MQTGGYKRNDANCCLRHLDPKKQVEDFANTVLQGRGQSADEIAAAALFLVSSESSAMTGQAVNVDGGMAFY